MNAHKSPVRVFLPERVQFCPRFGGCGATRPTLLGGCGAVRRFPEHPMPRFVDKTMLIIPGVRHNKSKICGIGGKPMKRHGVFKVLHQIWMSGGSYIESQSGVMLAEAGRSIYGENRVEVHALPQLLFDDFALMIYAAKAGDEQ